MERRIGMDRRAGPYSHPVVRATLIFLLGLAVVGVLLWLLRPMLFSLAVSLALFAALTPSVDRLRQLGWETTKAVAAVMVVTTLFIVAGGALIFPLVTDQVHQISHQAGELHQRLTDVLSEVNRWMVSHDMEPHDADALADRILTSVGSKMAAVHDSMRDFFSSVATSLLLIPLITFFLLCDFNKLRNQTMQLLPNRYFELGWIIYARAAGRLMDYIGGITTQALIMASICTFGFWLVDVDYAPLLGILIGLLNMIPFFGIAMAKVLPVVVVLMSDDPSGLAILLALSVVFAAQAFDNSYVIPKIVARSASLHPLTVMIGVMLGGYYFGFFGLILSVPMLFSLKVIHLELIRGLRRQAAHHRVPA